MDLFVDPPARILFAHTATGPACTIDGDELALANGAVAAVQQITLDGADLAARIAAVATTPGVGLSNVQASHILDASLDVAVVAEFPPAHGGTGASNFTENAVVFGAAGGSLVATPALRIDPTSGFLVVGGSASTGAISIAGLTFSASDTGSSLRLTDSAGTMDIADLPRGTAPVAAITAVTRTANGTEATLSVTAHDAESDHRAVHIVWWAAESSGNPALLAEEVVAWTLGGTGTGTTPQTRVVDILGIAFSAGSTTWAGDIVLDGLTSGQDGLALVVAEDGPGNLSLPVAITL